ncbi:hypothetical protein [Nocardioides sp. AE5]|uniref:hypothetical protein n=1 Tax=Nocardioides sp. AE5 TaxID=2962573 RepID=UPI002881DC67|nr:hypothetical protein [Nocardioides sp. AE5]MDT0201177.1 hypothetical protein [Nocardioides sp. AE5]
MQEQDRSATSPTNDHRWPVPPVWLVWFAGAITLTGLTLLITGAIRTGVTVDETFHTARLHNYLTHGWYLLDDDLTTHGNPGTWVEDRYVYGPITALLAHLANTLTGNETWTTVSTTANAYLIRHLTIATIAIAGTTATAAITRIITGTWRWALITTAILLSLPMWTGHAMFNIKDIPVATGYTLFTLACIHTLTHPRTPHHPWRHHLTTATLAYTGILLTLGTRPALWPGLGATGALLVLHLTLHRTTTPHPWRPLTPPLVATALALTTLALTYPNLYTNPHWLLDSATESAGYRGTNSWWMLPSAVVMTVPLLLLVLGVVGTLAGLAAWLRQRDWSARHAQVAMVAAQALLLPTLVWLQAAPISGGLRHVLFAAPAVAVLITLGCAHLLRSRPKWTASLIGLGMVAPMIVSVQLFPYAYAYQNVLASSGFDPPGSFSLPPDDYRASMREVARALPADAFVVCSPDVDEVGRPLRMVAFGGQSWFDLAQDCAHPGTGQLAPWRDAGSSYERVEGEFIAVVVKEHPVRGCTELARVTRHRLAERVRIATAWRCPLVLPTYAGPVALDGAGNGAETLLGGWSGTGGDGWITATGPASLGFHLPYDGGVRVMVTGTAEGAPTFRINNEPAAVTPVADGWILEVPGDRPEVGMAGNVVITVDPTHGADPSAGDQVRLTRVEVIGG